MVSLVRLGTAYVNPEQIVSIYRNPVDGSTTVLMVTGQQITATDASPAQLAQDITGRS